LSTPLYSSTSCGPSELVASLKVNEEEEEVVVVEVEVVMRLEYWD
jgi:hypothetical protein